MPQAVLAPTAKADGREIFHYIDARDPGAAERFFARFATVLVQLAHQPRMGTKADRLRRGLRFFPLGVYLIFYRVTPDGIEVVRFLHGARDIGPAYFAD